MQKSPAVIQPTQIGRSLVFELPRRQLGPLGWIALFMTVFGAVPAGFGAWQFMHSFGAGSGLFGIAVAAPFLIFSVVFDLIVLSIAFGVTTIELDDQSLRVIDRLVFLRWTRRQLLDQIERLDVHVGSARVNGQPVRSGSPLADLAVLIAHVRTRKRRRMITFGYPRSLLEPIAHTISERCANATSFTPGASAPEVAVVSAATSSPGANDTDLLQPASSDATVMRGENQLTITLPPRGFKGANRAMLGFSIMWNSFMALFTGGFVFSINQGSATHAASSLFVWVLIAVFWAIGVSTALYAFSLARRVAIIDVMSDTLMINRAGLFKTDTKQWRTAEITDIHFAPSGMEVNDRPVYNLQVHTHDLDGKTRMHGFFTSRNDDELRWIASELRAAIGLASRITTEAVSGHSAVDAA